MPASCAGPPSCDDASPPLLPPPSPPPPSLPPLDVPASGVGRHTWAPLACPHVWPGVHGVPPGVQAVRHLSVPPPVSTHVVPARVVQLAVEPGVVQASSCWVTHTSFRQ